MCERGCRFHQPAAKRIGDRPCAYADEANFDASKPRHEANTEQRERQSLRALAEIVEHTCPRNNHYVETAHALEDEPQVSKTRAQFGEAR